jgi:hypothetical protein
VCEVLAEKARLLRVIIVSYDKYFVRQTLLNVVLAEQSLHDVVQRGSAVTRVGEHVHKSWNFDAQDKSDHQPKRKDEVFLNFLSLVFGFCFPDSVQGILHFSLHIRVEGFLKLFE